jgi:hypothetical protein
MDGHLFSACYQLRFTGLDKKFLVIENFSAFLQKFKMYIFYKEFNHLNCHYLFYNLIFFN